MNDETTWPFVDYPYLDKELGFDNDFVLDATKPGYLELTHKGYRVKIVADSLHTDFQTGNRLTTMVVTYPRFVHSEMMTHRVFSRNAASSRAIPFEKIHKAIGTNPAKPYKWTKNQSGMVGITDGLTRLQLEAAERNWSNARFRAMEYAKYMNAAEIHKGQVNRLLEPFMWMTVVITSRKWRGFFAQRCHNSADPTLRHIAEMMRFVRDQNMPRPVQLGDWHLPFVYHAPDWDDLKMLPSNDLKRISAARCARVSYLNQEGVRDPQADIDLFGRLLAGPHWSPLEHPTMAAYVQPEWKDANYGVGWYQFRKEFDTENFGE